MKHVAFVVELSPQRQAYLGKGPTPARFLAKGGGTTRFLAKARRFRTFARAGFAAADYQKARVRYLWPNGHLTGI
ncbi:MAG TPA: hypothetical protein VEH04_17035 [Verrucomicrobiae bacterium]|nr:hypothetical protein [Verrucomicrobiae bacterium]